jgi:hypothetical protein
MQTTGQLGAQGQATPTYLAMNDAAKDIRMGERTSLGGGGTTPINTAPPSTVSAPAGYSQVPAVYVKRGAGLIG